MPRDLRAYLWDVLEAIKDIQEFTAGQSITDYSANPMLRAAVERKLEIIGEAIGQAVRYFPDISQRIDSYEQIIAFRNRLIHGYSTVSDRLVWEVVENHLSPLKEQSEALLKDCGNDPS
jgi:uncharacterized protein with HEPN domain